MRYSLKIFWRFYEQPNLDFVSRFCFEENLNIWISKCFMKCCNSSWNNLKFEIILIRNLLGDWLLLLFIWVSNTYCFTPDAWKFMQIWDVDCVVIINSTGEEFGVFERSRYCFGRRTWSFWERAFSVEGSSMTRRVVLTKYIWLIGSRQPATIGRESLWVV